MGSRPAGQSGPSAVEAYDFFCRVWEDTTEAQRPATPPPDPAEEGAGESRPLVELLGGEVEPLTRHVPPLILSRKAQREREAELYFAPALMPPALEERLPPGGQLRDLAEDGIYVAHRPLRVSRNLHKLENRLLRHSGRSWFGEDGQLICLPDPLLNRPCHHDYKDVSDDVLTDYIPASLDLLKAEPEPRGDQDLRLQLHVHVLSVELLQHPLFSRQHQAAAALSELHEEYTKMVRDDTVERLTQRLSILRRWRELKGLREDQGFSSTPLRLVVRDLSVDAGQEAERWRQELYQQELSEWKKRRHELAGDNRRPPGEPRLAFDLLDTHPVTELADCPKYVRRPADPLSVRAFVGAREVSRTRSQPLTQQMTAAFEQLFAVRLRHAPDAVQLWACEEGSLSSRTGEVLAPPDAAGGLAVDAALLPGPDPNDPAELGLTGQDLASLRCRLLRLRHAGVPEFRHVTMTPLREQQVPQQLFTTYQKRLEAQSDAAEAVGNGGGGGGGGGAESARRSVLQYQLRIKEMVARRFRAAQKHKRLSDVVREDQVPDIGTIGSVFGSLFSPRRPLNPPRRQKKSRPFVDIQGQELRLICHVVRAFNVPVRRDVDTVRTDFSRPAAGAATVAQSSLLPEVSVRPFMELTFQRHTVRSNVAEGANPTWNQDLKLPVTMPAHESADLKCLDDAIYLSLQDEVLVDLLEDDRQVDTNIHQRIERRWLAELRIPFSTLYINGRVEGTFRLNTPPLLIGYECDVTARGTVFHLTESLPTGQSGTYVTVFMTLEPPLNIPPMVQERLDSMESEKLLDHCEAWTRDYQRAFAGRRVRCTVMDVTGRSALVCRYIRPLRPPDAVLAGSSNEDDQARIVARFVSLIPNISDVNFFSGMYDLWTTCQEFLDMQAGDEEEHAILLCNFFLYLGKRAYLVLGSGIPEGQTAYVLTDEATDRFLWNPCSGQRSSVTESFSYLQNVGCLINADNVWANTQVYGHPAGMAFDVNLVRDWRPLFSSRHPAPADRLERRLRDLLQAWRQRSKWTLWNGSCSKALRRMLPLLERSTFTPALTPTQLADEQTRMLANIHATYKVCGVPLNVPYHSHEAVVESLFALGVHKNDSRDAEFALAVHMEPYPSDIVSVWVYVAALTKRR
ncbi:coiled-coil and C2 domain-containing protein 2A-like [Pollicipes pollicipes]|uniref:coiled-coil and C2 domain-containing protein 2A-like n=1 Tax=Pollicipes pollicipes TaxID=41117 RepID=UPI001884C2DB|nr:coiled-coil and C2 domain-containing protein 2A-like [Pollicipes pollicipes]